MCLWIDSRMFDVLPMEDDDEYSFRKTIHIMVICSRNATRVGGRLRNDIIRRKRFFRLMMGKI